jgi:hypothetical protein
MKIIKSRRLSALRAGTKSGKSKKINNNSSAGSDTESDVEQSGYEKLDKVDEWTSIGNGAGPYVCNISDSEVSSSKHHRQIQQVAQDSELVRGGPTLTTTTNKKFVFGSPMTVLAKVRQSYGGLFEAAKNTNVTVSNLFTGNQMLMQVVAMPVSSGRKRPATELAEPSKGVAMPHKTSQISATPTSERER